MPQWRGRRVALAECLAATADLAGLNRLASTHYFSEERDTALALWERIASDYSDHTDPASRVEVAIALVNKGVTLGQQGDAAAAIACYDAVFERFQDAPEPALQEIVSAARKLRKRIEQEEASRTTQSGPP